jgi:SAM-dependent methyltransferase
MSLLTKITKAQSAPTLPPTITLRKSLRYSVFCSIIEDEAYGLDGLHGIMDKDFVPDENSAYKSKQYWDLRFKKEASYEWLGNFDTCRAGYEKTGVIFDNNREQSVLVVGCGNSSFSKDLSLLCPDWRITSIDFSNVVIEKMRKQYPELTWIVQDMTKMEFPLATFDLILDKAAMDALVADEGNSWEPSESSCKSVDDMVESCAKVLKPQGGILSIVSFQPIHFRRRHLERAMEKSSRHGYAFESHIKIQTCENPHLGTEFAVFTLTRS